MSRSGTPASGAASAPTPRDEPRCPLCGKANECAAARTGSFASPCWCRDVEFSAELLARVPAQRLGLACICRSCAQPAAPAPKRRQERRQQ